jgi:hypothetical protein
MLSKCIVNDVSHIATAPEPGHDLLGSSRQFTGALMIFPGELTTMPWCTHNHSPWAHDHFLVRSQQFPGGEVAEWAHCKAKLSIHGELPVRWSYWSVVNSWWGGWVSSWWGWLSSRWGQVPDPQWGQFIDSQWDQHDFEVMTNKLMVRWRMSSPWGHITYQRWTHYEAKLSTHSEFSMSSS